MCKICEIIYRQFNQKPGGSKGTWSHNAEAFKGNPKKKLNRHDNSGSHKEGLVTLTSTKIKEALHKVDRKPKNEKIKANELYKTTTTFSFLSQLQLSYQGVMS